MKNTLSLFLAAAIVLLLNSCQKVLDEDARTGTVTVTFKNKVNTDPLTLNTVTYTNPFMEQYTVSRFKYYISNVAVSGSNGNAIEEESYHLIDESDPASLSFSFRAGVKQYSTLNFMIGVDSIRNVSGAQTGALDPAKGMFWTWNSGYIMVKFEGNSPASTEIGNRIEYHIGGFAGPDKVLKNLALSLPAGTILDVRENKTSEIVVEVDLDKWWQNPNDIKIADNAVSMMPGPLSKKFADNYVHMFSVKEVVNN